LASSDSLPGAAGSGLRGRNVGVDAVVDDAGRHWLRGRRLVRRGGLAVLLCNSTCARAAPGAARGRRCCGILVGGSAQLCSSRRHDDTARAAPERRQATDRGAWSMLVGSRGGGPRRGSDPFCSLSLLMTKVAPSITQLFRTRTKEARNYCYCYSTNSNHQTDATT
jgi:hypothetical protein